MPEASITPDDKPAKKKPAPGEFVVKHDLVGDFAKGTVVTAATLFPGVDDTAALIARLVDLEAIAPNAE